MVVTNIVEPLPFLGIYSAPTQNNIKWEYDINYLQDTTITHMTSDNNNNIYISTATVWQPGSTYYYGYIILLTPNTQTTTQTNYFYNGSLIYKVPLFCATSAILSIAWGTINSIEYIFYSGGDMSTLDLTTDNYISQIQISTKMVVGSITYLPQNPLINNNQVNLQIITGLAICNNYLILVSYLNGYIFYIDLSYSTLSASNSSIIAFYGLSNPIRYPISLCYNNQMGVFLIGQYNPSPSSPSGCIFELNSFYFTEPTYQPYATIYTSEFLVKCGDIVADNTGKFYIATSYQGGNYILQLTYLTVPGVSWNFYNNTGSYYPQAIAIVNNPQYGGQQLVYGNSGPNNGGYLFIEPQGNITVSQCNSKKSEKCKKLIKHKKTEEELMEDWIKSSKKILESKKVSNWKKLLIMMLGLPILLTKH